MSGLIRNLSREEYEAIDAVRFSRLKHILKSPAHYQHGLEDEDEDTAAMLLGRAVHCMVLEPHKSTFAVWEGARRQGKDYEAFCAAHAGKEILKREEMNKARAMAESVLNKKSVQALMTSGSSEVSLTWEDEGLSLKGRVDWLGGSLWDLKTCKDVGHAAFARDCALRAYHMQLAMYGRGVFQATREKPPCHIVAVENKEPYDVVVYRVPKYANELGEHLYSLALKRLKSCTKANSWPGLDNGAEEVELSLPAWAMEEQWLLSA